VAPEITGPGPLWLFPLGVREGQSLCTSTTRNRGWTAGTHHCSCHLGHAGYAAESLVRARLLHRCLPSNKRGAHWVCVIPHETVWVYATVATHFYKNIPVSFDFITTWNQGVFSCSSCIIFWMANCTYFDNTHISQPIPIDLWTSKVSNSLPFHKVKWTRS
jgi:hypothetical protein